MPVVCWTCRGSRGFGCRERAQITGCVGFVPVGIPKVGRMNLIYISDTRGRIVTELSCIRLGEDNFVLITAASAQWHDGELIRKSVPEGVNVRETTTERDTLVVTGPYLTCGVGRDQ